MTRDQQPTSAPPPHNLDAERALLGAALLSPEALETLVSDTGAADFYSPTHGNVAHVLRAAYAAGDTVDTVTIWERLERAGLTEGLTAGELVSWMTSTPAATNARRYAEIVRSHAVLRRLMHTGTEIVRIAEIAPDPGAAVTAAREALDRLDAGDSTELSTLDVADIAALLDSDLAPEEPDLLTRSDGAKLLYAGKMHVFQAEPSSGKTWIALLGCAEVLTFGGAAVYIDFEDTSTGILGRLLSLGASPADVRERFAYLQPAGAFGTHERAHLNRLLEELNPDLVVIDGVGEALARDGLSEDRAPEVLAWVEKLPRPIARTGAAVLMLDHVVKSREDQGRWARGSGAKLASVDGASYQVKVLSSFSRHKPGSLKLVVAKDRPGGVGAIGDTAGIASIDPHADGKRVVVQLDPDSADLHTGDPWRPTIIMERVSKTLEDSKVPLTASAVKSIVHGEKRLVEEAISRLLAEGYIRESGRGRAKTLAVVKPFRDGKIHVVPDRPPTTKPIELFDPDPYYIAEDGEPEIDDDVVVYPDFQPDNTEE